METFIEQYERSYGVNHPPFHRDSYAQVERIPHPTNILCDINDVFEIQALEVAKRELRFLLVYLHSEDHQDTDRFCTEVK